MYVLSLQGLQAEAFARTEQPLLNMAVMAGQLGSVKARAEPAVPAALVRACCALVV